MAKTIKLADYLFKRLQQLGVGAIHGVPGDYNLNLLDYVEPSGLLWVGNTNELNAGYAADGYARIKGMGALITTYGVGELSAINAIACAFTERAAVVHIVGTPPRDSQDARLMIHHTLGDGDYRHFSHMSAHVTVAQVNLTDPRTAPQQIDQVLEQCILHSRPIYIEVPVDMVEVQISADRLSSVIEVPAAVPNTANDAVLDTIMDKIYSAKQPVILVDGETRSLRLEDKVQTLVNITKWPTFTTAFGTGLIDMTLPNVHGIYKGNSAVSGVKEYVDNSDLVLFFGPHPSSTNSYFWSSIPKPEVTISFTHNGIKIGGQLHRSILASDALSRVIQDLDHKKVRTNSIEPDFPRSQTLSFSDTDSQGLIKHDKAWRLLANFLRPGDIILGETGTAAYGIREMPLPKHTRVFTSVTWLSIGYMLPASQGAALAQRELIASSQYHDLSSGRTILVIGDGSFQMTAQELSTIIRLNLNVVVFLINNDGYTIERCIHGKNQTYNDVARWRYLQAPNFFGAKDDTHTASARTYGELGEMLSNEVLANDTGLRMVEIFMDRMDAPAGPLLDLMDKQKDLVNGH